MSAPYFHDGSAPTLEEVLQAGTVHSVFEQLSSAELAALIGYLKALPVGG
jgi:cytochrome c peroxidase